MKIKQFTLIELIIVIVVVGLLIGMALPKFIGVQRNAKIAAMVADIDTLEKAIQMYQLENDILPIMDENKNTFGLQKLNNNEMREIYTSLKEVLSFEKDTEETLYKINLDESNKYHSKTKYGHNKTNKDFYVYSTRTSNVYYYGLMKNGDNEIQHNNKDLNLKDSTLENKIPSLPIDTILFEDNDMFLTLVGGQGSDSFYGTELTSDGGTISVGYTEGGEILPASNGKQDFLITKTNKNGEIEWTKNYGNTNNDVLYDIKETSDGGYITYGRVNGTGYFGNTNNQSKGIFLKLDNKGNIEWYKTYGLSKNSVIYDAILTGNNEYILVGYTHGTLSNEIQTGLYSSFIIKIDKQGNTIWEKVISGSNNKSILRRVEKTSDGNFIAVGYMENNTLFPNIEGKYDGAIIKFDNEGNVIWTNSYGQVSSEEYFLDIIETSDKGFVTSGINITTGLGIIVKYDKNGNQEWHIESNDYGMEELYSIIEVQDGYILSGNTKGFEIEGIVLKKINKNGQLIWNKKHTNLDSINSRLEEIVETQNGDIVGIGYCGYNDNDLKEVKGIRDGVIIKFNSNGDYKK